VAESSWPSPSNGRTVTDIQYEKIGIGTGPVAGVIGDFTSPQLIYGDSSGRQIKVAADRYAVVGGHIWWSGSSIVTTAIAANASGSTRTDLVVLRLSRTTWDVNLVVIAGTPGSGAPSPVQNVGTTGSFDLPLATVTVASGTATITAGNVAYVAAHLGQEGVPRSPSQAALAYIPLKYPGMRALMSDGTRWQYRTTLWVPDPVVCIVKNSGTPTVTVATGGAVVSWDSDVMDPLDWHGGTSSRVTPNAGHGIYTCKFVWQFNNNGTGRRGVAIRVNGGGSPYYGAVVAATSLGNMGCSVEHDIELNGTTDYVEGWVFQDSGGNVPCGDYVSSRMSVTLTQPLA
jgi:hypothetical protein